MEEIIVGLVGFVLGGFAMRWQTRRPRKAAGEDRGAGLARYQDYKGNR